MRFYVSEYKFIIYCLVELMDTSFSRLWNEGSNFLLCVKTYLLINFLFHIFSLNFNFNKSKPTLETIFTSISVVPSQVKLKEKVPITISFFLYDILYILRDPSELNKLNTERNSNLINQRLFFFFLLV